MVSIIAIFISVVAVDSLWTDSNTALTIMSYNVSTAKVFGLLLGFFICSKLK